VFLPSPLNGQAPVIANGPAPTKPKRGMPSPRGWLSKKKQYARMITGNNAQARRGRGRCGGMRFGRGLALCSRTAPD
jgi:hypothetical protein